MPARGFVRVTRTAGDPLRLHRRGGGEGQDAFNATLTDILLDLVPEAGRELALLPPVPGRHRFPQK
jgi:hypothetical protein